MARTAPFKRILGAWDCANLILGVMIGIGIFSTFPALVAQHVGSSGLILLVWALGGLLAWCVGVCYAELSTIFPSSGGDYAYLRSIYSTRGESVIAFLFGWTTIFIIRPSSIAILALIFSNEMCKSFLMTDSRAAILLIAVSLVVLLTVINALSFTIGKNFQNVYTVVKIVLLAFIIGFGLMHPNDAAVVSAPPAAVGNGGIGSLVVGMFRALVLCMWVYGGWSEAVYVVEETRNPSQSIPRALFWGIMCVTVVYMGMQVVYLKYFSAATLGQTFNPASELMGIWFGRSGSAIMSGVIAVAAFGAINGLIITGGRFSRAIANDYPRFNRFASLHARWGTPVKALAANLTITLIMLGISMGKVAFIENLTFYTSGVFWCFFGLVVIGLLILRTHVLPQNRTPGYRSWLYTLNPIVFLVVVIGLIWGAIEFKPLETLTGICILTLGIPIYYALRIDDRRKELRIPSVKEAAPDAADAPAPDPAGPTQPPRTA
jgi:APA family basic amino acid/polyamine antiporter